MCLAHSRYAGCNNNMGVEVSWRLIKSIWSCLATLAQLIGALCKLYPYQNFPLEYQNFPQMTKTFRKIIYVPWNILSLRQGSYPGGGKRNSSRRKKNPLRQSTGLAAGARQVYKMYARPSCVSL